MKTMFVVMKYSYDGDSGENGHPVAIFATCEAADAYCDQENAKKTSGYSPRYDWDEVVVMG